MKLRQHNLGGAQSLGQVNINAPAQKWQAKTNAQNSMVNAFQQGANVLSELFDAQDDAGSKLLLQERILADGVVHARSLSYLENSPVIDLAAQDVPDSVRAYATQWATDNPDAQGNAPQRVKTHEIIDGYMQNIYRDTTSASVDALKDSGLASDYVKAMDEGIIRGSAQTMKIKLTQRQEDLKASADAQFGAAVQANDETSAQIIAGNNVEIGAWTPKIAAENLAKLGPQLDYNNINEAITVSETQGELDAAIESMEQSRVLPEDRPKLLAKFRLQQNHFTTLETGKKSRNYETGMSLLNTGRLTKSWVTEKLNSHELSGGQANTLINALNKPAPLTSSPAVLDAMRQRIAWIKYGNDSETTTVTERAQQVHRELARHVNGINPDGTVSQPTLRGEDMLKLGEQIDAIVNKALGAGGQQYGIAVKQITAFTGYSDMFEKAFEGPYPAGMAKNAFNRALNNYMDYAGPDADPIEFIAKNADKYSAENYTKQHIERMSIQYPQYNEWWGAGEAVLKLQPYAVLAMALNDYTNGKLDYADYENIRISLAYTGVTPDAYNTYKSADQVAEDVTSAEATGMSSEDKPEGAK